MQKRISPELRDGPPVLEALHGAGLTNDQVTFVCALGTQQYFGR